MTNNNNANGNWKTKLEQLEEQIRKAAAANQSSQQSNQDVSPYVEMDSETYFAEKAAAWMEMTRNWFNALSKPGKVIVGVCAVWLGFSALNTVFHLISSLLSLVVLGVILYFIYTKFIKSNG
ncbi:MAG: hypothetical protein AAGA80_21525 [Cyanobacteria bacterium P01_F01_bin.143]